MRNNASTDRRHGYDHAPAVEWLTKVTPLTGAERKARWYARVLPRTDYQLFTGHRMEQTRREYEREAIATSQPEPSF